MTGGKQAEGELIKGHRRAWSGLGQTGAKAPNGQTFPSFTRTPFVYETSSFINVGN